MTGKLENALERLTNILPLIKSQHECDPALKELHQQILRSFVANGRALLKEEMAAFVSNVPEALNELSERELVVLSQSGELTGIYPFSTQKRKHSVLINGYRVYAMCALDALAVAPLFDESTVVTSTCQVTDKPVLIEMRRGAVQNLEDVNDVHIGITWSAVDMTLNCADSLCLEMVFLINKQTAEGWQSAEVKDREVFALNEAVQFASLFFKPLLT
ncbi:MAG: hypothetical protein A6F70_04040 [Cycloclasticus sp. symbiont of Bathymodiolus heckerae]|nr:MAG: hypothetical protein A6F70_04040 [Cycloclasticus sp. symbiont of Bathymodiolus heckerae]